MGVHRLGGAREVEHEEGDPRASARPRASSAYPARKKTHPVDSDMAVSHRHSTSRSAWRTDGGVHLCQHAAGGESDARGRALVRPADVAVAEPPQIQRGRRRRPGRCGWSPAGTPGARCRSGAGQWQVVGDEGASRRGGCRTGAVARGCAVPPPVPSPGPRGTGARHDLRAQGRRTPRTGIRSMTPQGQPSSGWSTGPRARRCRRGP